MTVTPRLLKDIVKNSVDIGDITNEHQDYALMMVAQHKSPVRYYKSFRISDLLSDNKYPELFHLGYNRGRVFRYCDLLLSIKSDSPFYFSHNGLRISDKVKFFKPQDPFNIRTLVFGNFAIEFPEEIPETIKMEYVCTPLELELLLIRHSSSKIKFRMGKGLNEYILLDGFLIATKLPY